ncbi:MAG: LuxR C-terminal-related transcriptional regulator [Candidatus Cybelea sp.]
MKTGNQSATALSLKELAALRKRIGKNTNGELFKKGTVARLLATLDEGAYTGGAAILEAKRREAKPMIRELRRRLASTEADNVLLRSAIGRITSVAAEFAHDEEISRCERRASALTLPPMQRIVFEEICRGKTTKQIAEELQRSEHTIRNHAKLIFRAFGVKGRTSLVAEVLRQQTTLTNKMQV